MGCLDKILCGCTNYSPSLSCILTSINGGHGSQPRAAGRRDIPADNGAIRATKAYLKSSASGCEALRRAGHCMLQGSCQAAGVR